MTCPACDQPLWLQKTVTPTGILFECSCDHPVCTFCEIGYGDTAEEAFDCLAEKWRKQHDPDENHLRDFDDINQ